jgi:hypothetical protein
MIPSTTATGNSASNTSLPAGAEKRDPSEQTAAGNAVLGGELGQSAGKGTARSELQSMLDYRQALYDQRFDGIVNFGPKAISKLPKGQRHREAAEGKIAAARRLLAETQGDVIDEQTSTQISDLLKNVYSESVDEKGKKKPIGDLAEGDSFLDDITEYVGSNITCIAATAATEFYNAKLERENKPRTDAKKNWSGWVKEFSFKSIVYFVGIAASRGKNFYSKISKIEKDGKETFEQKITPTFLGIEVGGTVMMVAGATLGAKFMEHDLGINTTVSSVVASALAGFAAGYAVYAALMFFLPESANSSALKGALRAMGNVTVRQGLGPLFRSKESKEKAKRENTKHRQEELARKSNEASAKDLNRSSVASGPATSNSGEKAA